MNNYYEDKHKIRTIYNNLQTSKQQYDKLKKQLINKTSINYIKTKNEYIIDEITTTDNYYGKSWYIELKNFPENILPFIKIIPIISTTTAFEDEIATWFQLGDRSQFVYFINKRLDIESDKDIFYISIYYYHGINYIDELPPIILKLKMYIDLPQNYDELRTNKT